MNDDILLKFEDSRGIFSFQIKLSERKIQDADTGYLYCYDAIFGHTGVQEYYARELKMGGNEIIKVHRFAEDVFSDEAMASIKGKSVTNRHPSVKVTSKNYKDLEIGTILDVRQDGENVVGDIVIKDADAIMDILEGNDTALSLGYQAKLVPIEDGDYKQTQIVINHLARVPKGRAKNAQIRDEDTIVKEKSKMGFWDFIKGKKIQLNDDETITVLEDGIKVVYKETSQSTEERDDYDDPKTKIVTVTKRESVVTKVSEDDVKDEDEVKKSDEKADEVVVQETKEVKDEENQEKKEEKDAMTEEQIKAFKDELRAEMIAELKVEMKKDKSVFDDVKVIETQDGEKEDKVLSLNFQKDEELRKLYWDKMTNPVAHGGNFKALNAFRQRATDLVVR